MKKLEAIIVSMFLGLTVQAQAKSQIEILSPECRPQSKAILKCSNQIGAHMKICQQGLMYHFAVIEDGVRETKQVAVSYKGNETKYFYSEKDLMIGIAVVDMQNQSKKTLAARFEITDLKKQKTYPNNIQCERL